eukprot:GILJ01010411.1.p1 GENE.GILJ01010411.1~~GILJ01010411.1.p1  ORF type:complete len:391 (+),score=23.92 GILJ01010411.1:30-1202(+)
MNSRRASRGAIRPNGSRDNVRLRHPTSHVASSILSTAGSQTSFTAPMRSSSSDTTTTASATTNLISRPAVPSLPTMSAAALQEHLTRSLGLSLSAAGPRNAAPKIPSKAPTKVPASIKKSSEPLEVYKRKLTLAQRMGLVEAPAPPLSETQWSEIKSKTKARQEAFCPICMEEFALEQQVILSCSHVFHKTCLTSFEKFSKSKSCPMCRKQAYEKRTFDGGKELYAHRCATQIQAHWRGYKLRQAFYELQRANPPKDPRLRRKFFGERLRNVSDRFFMELDREHDSLDSFLAEIDSSLEQSRKVINNAASMADARTVTEEVWTTAREKALGRADTVCPICYCELNARKEVCLLTCSHVFHSQCIQSFENFNVYDNRQCPLCRALYQKQNL